MLPTEQPAPSQNREYGDNYETRTTDVSSARADRWTRRVQWPYANAGHYRKIRSGSAFRGHGPNRLRPRRAGYRMQRPVLQKGVRFLLGIENHPCNPHYCRLDIRCYAEVCEALFFGEIVKIGCERLLVGR